MKPPFGTNGLGGTRLNDGLSKFLPLVNCTYDDGTENSFNGDNGVNVLSIRVSSNFGDDAAEMMQLN